MCVSGLECYGGWVAGYDATDKKKSPVCFCVGKQTIWYCIACMYIYISYDNTDGWIDSCLRDASRLPVRECGSAREVEIGLTGSARLGSLGIVVSFGEDRHGTLRHATLRHATLRPSVQLASLVAVRRHDLRAQRGSAPIPQTPSPRCSRSRREEGTRVAPTAAV